MKSTQKEEGKHFIITHKDKKCNASFTVKSNVFCNFLRETEKLEFLCPNCGEQLIRPTNLREVAEIIHEYANVKKRFENADIRELKEELDPKKLRL